MKQCEGIEMRKGCDRVVVDIGDVDAMRERIGCDGCDPVLQRQGYTLPPSEESAQGRDGT